MAYIGSSPTKVVSRQSANIVTYTATAHQTAFTGADDNSNTLACSPSDIMVHMNGIKLEESDYTASTTTVTLVSGAAAGDEVTITAFLTFESADHYTKSAADTRYVNTSGDTMTGNLGIGAAPTRALHVEHATDATMIVNAAAGNQATYLLGEGGASKFNMSHRASDDTFQIYNYYNSGASLKIDSSGHVTMPNVPRYLYNGGTTLANNTIVTLKPQTAIISTGGHYSTSTGMFTAPVGGTYAFGLWGLMYSANTNTITIYALKNNAQWGDVVQSNPTSPHFMTNCNIICELSTNDTFSWAINRSTNTADAYSGQWNQWGYLLG